MRIPKDELTKAIAEVEAENSDEPPNTSEQRQTNENSGSQTHLPSIIKEFGSKRNKQTKNNNAKTKGTSTKIIELAIFSDESLYEKWKLRDPSSPLKSMKKFMLTLVQNVNRAS